jgi:hypothetical protein
MKNLVTIFASILLFTFAVNNSFAQNEVSASAEAAATIVAPITIEKSVDLNFGNIAAGAAAGTVVLGTDGQRTATNVILPSVQGTVSAAEFSVTGLAGSLYSIKLPGTISISSGSASMSVNNFTENASKTLANGRETFQVGATLNLDANQATGTYQGSFEVTVDYQ